jgi:hypothetical protein
LKINVFGVIFEHAKSFLIYLSFEHVNFAINGQYSKKHYDNLASLGGGGDI